MKNRRAKGIGLLSGGLDSILAVKVLQEQDLDLLGVTFVTPFFGPQPGLDAGRIAGVPILALDIGEKHLAMLKNPVYGYGSQINPCIDCHGLMLREAGDLMEKEGADFLFTGEVLGQRPMSQRRDSLRSVEKLSGFPGRVLRPLSAQLLPPTAVELQGIVDRDRLLSIQGRGRKTQIELAAGYGISEYPQPGGGCMLTKEGFAKKLKGLLLRNPVAGLRQVEALKWGRSFDLPSGSWCVVGRNRDDNAQLEKIAAPEDTILRLRDGVGPTCLLMAPAAPPEPDMALAAAILAAYGDTPPDPAPIAVVWRGQDQTGVISTTRTGKDRFDPYHV